MRFHDLLAAVTMVFLVSFGTVEGNLEVHNATGHVHHQVQHAHCHQRIQVSCDCVSASMHWEHVRPKCVQGWSLVNNKEVHKGRLSDVFQTLKN